MEASSTPGHIFMCTFIRKKRPRKGNQPEPLAWVRVVGGLWRFVPLGNAQPQPSVLIGNRKAKSRDPGINAVRRLLLYHR